MSAPTLVDTYKALRLTIEQPVPTVTAVQWRDGWTSEMREARFTGLCLSCDRPTWTWVDGRNDPRGPLGNFTLHEVEAPNRRDPDVEHPARCCADCANRQDTYEFVVDLVWRAEDPASLAPIAQET